MKKYVLFGTSMEGEKLLYQYPKLTDDIEYCIDSFHTGEFHGIPIVKLDEAGELQRYTIIVAAMWSTYVKIKRLLEERGYREYINFFWGAEWNKKLVLVNMNCYGGGICSYLDSCRHFSEKYCIHLISTIPANSEKRIAEELLQRADVYIHQDIRANNFVGYELSDVYTRKLLKPNCLDITVPNLVGMGNWMYPTQDGMGKVVHSPDNGIIYVWYRDRVLQEAYQIYGADSLERYISFYENYKLDENLLEDEYVRCWEKMRAREKNWDVKITDFIFDHYRSVPCLVDCDHPSKYVMHEIGRQIAEIMGIDDVVDLNCYESKLGLPTPVLKCVADHYGLNWKRPNDRQKNLLLGYSTDNDLEEYIKEYLWWYYGVTAV